MKSGERIILFLLSLFWVFIISIDSVSAADTALSEEAQKCLGCHAQLGIVKKFENNESVTAYVDAEKFKASVHNSLTCSDCHDEFSSDKHPARKFRSKKQYKIRSSLVCKHCHTDQQISAKPIHASLLGEESENKSHVCTDCHGSHSIMPVAGGKIFASEKQYCLSCHGHKLNMVFKDGETLALKVDALLIDASVHNKLTCSDCHYGFSSEEHPQRNFRTKRDYAIASAESCRRCHFDKYTKTMESIHYTMLSQGNLKAPVCTDCHGSHSIPPGGKEKNFVVKKCQRCHPEIYEIYAKSIHGKALISEHIQDVPICIDCHTAHNITDPRTSDYRERVPDICGNCHANKEIMEKYGLSTDVVKTYLSDFHGVTLGFYKKQKETLYKPARQIAVCTDCHGTHNISSVIGSDAAIIKANLAKRCQKCHEGATENFQDAWLSHYKPSLTRAPMVFIVSLIYRVFIPFAMIGLILQILLHIWRYAVTR